ncbi:MULTISPECIES: lipocalin-like domain-containing protein [Halorhodospira]|uniref:lipocalin-like domain-containing protein n=1 Tax=Halorhodospira TaxID=85108 RepID=UPI001EE8517C|nr:MULTISPECIES: lipocalin-like domain-containing protein [Halorhodospira]MCG5528363.1 carotenoid 1,2-hydratase [Halorhodospira halophila]MCG5542529.1 carotenoid 1,2-hydratase [Halorhodospira sp. 9628]
MAERLGRLLRGGVVVVTVLLLAGCTDPPEQNGAAGQQGVTVAGALSGEQDAQGFARALGPRPLVFPRDHGPHPDYRHEWWYITGNVFDEDGRHFGFQVTFFRFALSPEPAPRRSAWGTNQLWMAHFAVTDTEGETFHHFERLARGAVGLAGARPDPFRVWLEDWEVRGAPGQGLNRLRTRLEAEGVVLELDLRARKPMVFQGEDGYSRKGDDPGNASYYYTLPRLQAAGRLAVPDGEHTVSGSAWIDREWGSSTLSEEQTGWDWFSIQLDDDRELMFYHLRREDGSIDPRSKGGWVEADGRHRVVTRDDVHLEVLEHWTSPDGEATYPARWRLEYPEEELTLELEPVLADQELRDGFRYWEGALRGRGEAAGRPVSAVGYAELTGYVD